ncbi:MAG: DUF4435 domain-containing protein [Bacteroidales bacterium]|nr:DUF4435 domain-containing protein [Bacteroidales bacterium]
MKLTLPPRSGDRSLTIDERRITVIGANGAGKTRFARRIAEAAGDLAFNMSAIKAIYGRDEEDNLPASIDSLYHAAVAKSALIRPDIRGELDRVIALLINDTATGLMAARFGSDEAENLSRHNKLDTVIRYWQELFPDNKILITYGRMLVNSADNDDIYPTGLLSSGERAVMYYLGAAMFAPQGGVVVVSSPEMFLHASVVRPLWDRIESLRPDCTFVYVTHDLGFAATRTDSAVIWVRSCDNDTGEWDYERLRSPQSLPDDIFMAILGERKPVLFIEGDGINSYDAKLYPLIFKEFTVKSLGGCDRVIEATRSFNGLRSIHNLDAFGIVDRDRRDTAEVNYLRGRKVLVPEVAEIENLFMLEDVVRTMAARNRRRPDQVFAKVRRNLLHLFEGQIKRQALEHTRHRLKKEVAHRVDGKFDNITELERHITEMMLTINPRGIYQSLLKQFESYVRSGDYAAVLRVFNHKSMLSETHVASLCGLQGDDKKTFITYILNLLEHDSKDAETIRAAIRKAFDI